MKLFRFFLLYKYAAAEVPDHIACKVRIGTITVGSVATTAYSLLDELNSMMRLEEG